MSKLAFLLLIALGAGTQSQTSGQETSSCEFGNSAFEGHLITIRARLAFGTHGVALKSDACPSDARAATLYFPVTGGSVPVTFGLDEHAEDLLRPFFNRNGTVPKACGSLKGQIFRKQSFELRSDGGGPTGNGYGYRGIYEYAFVLQSVENIHACDWQ
jgi:hypothetical protein